MTALQAALAWARAHADLGVAVREADIFHGHDPLSAAAAIPFVRTEVLRPAALRTWRDRVDATRAALAAGAPIDLAILGAGPTAGLFARSLSRARPDLAIVVVDRAVPGGPFTRAGAGFRLNTWNAPGWPGLSLVDEVDLHYGLVVTPSLMSAARFPPGDTLGDAALLTWAELPCGAVQGEVTRIATGDDIAFELAGGARVAARAAVLASGFGAEPLRSFDAAGCAFVAAEAARPFHEQRVLDAETAFARVAASGTQWLGVERVAVVGSGPSALGVLALACGLGPAEVTDAPGRFSRWSGRPKLVWVTGANGPASARELLDASPEPGNMGYVIAEGAATLARELVVLERMGRLEVVRGRVDTLAGEGARVQLRVSDRAITADRAVLCTGYTPRLAPLLGADSLAALAPRVVRAGDEPIALALAGDRVHVIGAAIEEIVTPDDTRPPFAESAMRVTSLADQLAQTFPPGRATPAMWNAAVHRSTPVDEEPVVRPWDRVLAPLDALLAVLPLRCTGPRVELHLGPELRCVGVDPALVALRLPARLAACAARHGKISIAIDVVDGRVVPASARET